MDLLGSHERGATQTSASLKSPAGAVAMWDTVAMQLPRVSPSSRGMAYFCIGSGVKEVSCEFHDLLSLPFPSRGKYFFQVRSTIESHRGSFFSLSTSGCICGDSPG